MVFTRLEKLLVDGLFNKLDPHWMPMAQSAVKVCLWLCVYVCACVFVTERVKLEVVHWFLRMFFLRARALYLAHHVSESYFGEEKKVEFEVFLSFYSINGKTILKNWPPDMNNIWKLLVYSQVVYQLGDGPDLFMGRIVRTIVDRINQEPIDFLNMISRRNLCCYIL